MNRTALIFLALLVGIISSSDAANPFLSASDDKPVARNFAEPNGAITLPRRKLA